MRTSNFQPYVHSFPRSCSGDPSNACAKKVRLTLDSFLRFGPLLIPEIIDVPSIPEHPMTSEPFSIFQTRFCLTTFEQNLLKDHMKLFGPISIVFKPTAVLRAGAVPVFYFPSFEMKENENALGLSIVHHLRASISFLQDFSYLKSMEPENFYELLGYKICKRDHRLVNEVLDVFLSSTGRSIDTLEAIEGALQSISELLYPANRSRTVDSPIFQYFCQREWRILSNMRVDGKNTSIPISSEISSTLINLDEEFFCKKLFFNGNRFQRIDKVEQLSDPIRVGLLSGIESIYCENHFADIVKDMLNEFELNIKIQLVN